MANKEILIVAGPNGAGKTTFALTFLRVETRSLPFLNADMIAAGLDPFGSLHSDAVAGRLMLSEMDRLAAEGRSFAFETTLAGRGYLRRIDRWRRDGYLLTLMFLSLPSPEHARERVRRRVEQGGHHIPEDVIRRRFKAGPENFWNLYSARVDDWMLYDNSGVLPVMVDRRADHVGT